MSRSLVLASALLALAGCTPSEPPTGDSGPAGGTPAGTTPSEVCDQRWDNRTVGLLECRPGVSPGYTLFAPLNHTSTYLIDTDGKLVHTWTSEFLSGDAVYLEPNGHLLRTAMDNGDVPLRGGGAGGRLQEFDWDGNLVWEWVYKGEDHLLHHDVTRLPNGNLVAIAWQAITAEEALALGRDPELVEPEGLWGVHLVEVEPSTNTIVWQWHVFDHVIQDRDPAAANYGVLADNPGKIDIDRTWAWGFGGSASDWNHVNGVDYNAELDQIVLSAHNQDEIWILDHGTTTEEAASDSGGTRGRGGDLLYRWGSPANYGMAGEQQLSGQHDAEWIRPGHPGEGNLLVFNNGNAWGFSAVVELELPLNADGTYDRAPDAAYGPAAPVWSHGEEGDFFSSFVSGSQRLPNGNTLICEGDNGRFLEVTPDGELVWEYLNPVGPQGPVEQGFDFGPFGLINGVFRADRYAPDFGAFEGRDLSPKGTVER